MDVQLTEPELRALMMASLGGDTAAHKTLLERLSIQLRGYFRGRLGRFNRGPVEAEDLVQESLIAIHTRRDTYDPSQPFTPWVYGIARYKFVDYLRRTKISINDLPIEDAGEVTAQDDRAHVESSLDLESSIIELLSGLVVLWRFRSQAESETARTEKVAARVAGALLFAVALFVATMSSFALLGYYEPRMSVVGIALLIVAAFGMPWLANQKRKLANQLSSPALRADAAESSLCGYLSWIALVGLIANALFRIRWADPIAALTLLPFIFKEGWQAIHTSRPGCGCCSVEATKGGVAANI